MGLEIRETLNVSRFQARTAAAPPSAAAIGAKLRRLALMAMALSGLVAAVHGFTPRPASASASPVRLATGDEVREKIDGDANISSAGNVIIKQGVSAGSSVEYQSKSSNIGNVERDSKLTRRD